MIMRSVIPRAVTNGGSPPGIKAREAAAALMAAKTAFTRGDVAAASKAANLALLALESLTNEMDRDREKLIDRANAEKDGIIAVETPVALHAAVSVYDRYFGTMRVIEATVGEIAIAIAPVMMGLVAKLPSIGLPLNDRAVLTDFAAHTLDPGAEDVEGQTVETTAVITAAANNPLERWKVGHAFYGLACRRASIAITNATRLFGDSDFEGTAGQMRTAAHLVRVVTAAMEYAAAMSSDNYSAQVRPSMHPPLLELDLTGFMNLDYRLYRGALDGFIEVCNQTFNQLVRTSRAIAEARDNLLHLDLIDIERHIALTYRLVGHLPALDERQDGSAVQALRSSYLRRMRRYSPLLLHGHITNELWS